MRLNSHCSSVVNADKNLASAIRTAASARFSNSFPPLLNVAGSARPDATDSGRLTAPRFSKRCNTVFIACGVTPVYRASCALDNPGCMESTRMQTNSGRVNPNGPRTAVARGRSDELTRYNRYPSGALWASTMSDILTYIRCIDM